MTHDTPPKRIWAIEYRGEAVPRSGEWVAEQSDAPEGANSYTLTSEAEAMVAAVLREASGVAFDAVFDEMNAVFARNTQRRILALIPQPASVALDKLIAEAEARGMERAETHIAAIERLAISASIASCTCLTKTPDITFHAADCRYVYLQYIIAQCEDFRAANGDQT